MAEEPSPARWVVIIDDHPETALSLAEVLRLRGHDAQARLDPLPAVEAIVSDPPDLVLIDIEMPGDRRLLHCEALADLWLRKVGGWFWRP